MASAAYASLIACEGGPLADVAHLKNGTSRHKTRIRTTLGRDLMLDKETRMKTINVAMIGQGFMGRSHSNAWGQVAKFFKCPIKPVMHTVFGQPEENPQAFAENWGWKNASTDWEQLVKSPDIGLVDIVTPNFMHAPPAKAAIAAGKAVACEKPIAGTLSEAREMAQAARKAGVPTAVWFCYRRCPAVALGE